MNLYHRIVLTAIIPLLLLFVFQVFQFKSLLEEQRRHIEIIDENRSEYIAANVKKTVKDLQKTSSFIFQTPDSIRAVETADNYYLFNWLKQFINKSISHAVVTDAEGTVLARGHEEYHFGEDLRQNRAVISALAGQGWIGFLEIDGVGTIAAAEPVYDFGGRLIGSVLLGLELSPKSLYELRSDNNAALIVKSQSGIIASIESEGRPIRGRTHIALPGFSEGSELYLFECLFYEDFQSSAFSTLVKRLMIQQLALLALVPLLLILIIRVFFKDLTAINTIIRTYSGEEEKLELMERSLARFSGSRDKNVLLLSGSILKMITEIRSNMVELNRQNMELKKISRTDALTGLPNRMLLDKELNREVLKSRRSGSPLAILLFDLDHFKMLNDTLGHLTGDLVLKQFSDMLGASIRNTDLAGRWGGEEFLVLLPDTDSPGAEILAEKCRIACEVAGWLENRPVTCSIGIAVMKPDDTPDSLLGRADAALYRAKDQGRNRTSF